MSVRCHRGQRTSGELPPGVFPNRRKEVGYDEIVVQVTPGCENMVEDWARVFETV
jgi:hypothetical protein